MKEFVKNAIRPRFEAGFRSNSPPLPPAKKKIDQKLEKHHL